MTLEDETGFVNVVVWKRVFDQHDVLARTATFLGVTGKAPVRIGRRQYRGRSALGTADPGPSAERRQPGFSLTSERSATSRRSETAGRTSEACRPLTCPTSLATRRVMGQGAMAVPMRDG